MITLALVFLPDRLAPSASASTSAGISLSNVSRASTSRARFPVHPPVVVPVVVSVSTVSTVVSVVAFSVSIVADVSIARRSIDVPVVSTVAHDGCDERPNGPTLARVGRPETSRGDVSRRARCVGRRRHLSSLSLDANERGDDGREETTSRRGLESRATTTTTTTRSREDVVPSRRVGT